MSGSVGRLVLASLAVAGLLSACGTGSGSGTTGTGPASLVNGDGVAGNARAAAAPAEAALPAVVPAAVAQSSRPQVTLAASPISCAEGSGAARCWFTVTYGNGDDHPLELDAMTTVVIDASGRSFSASTYGQRPDDLVVNPGLAVSVSWSVTMPSGATPTRVDWTDADGNLFSTAFAAPPPPARDADAGDTSGQDSSSAGQGGQDLTPEPADPGTATTANAPADGSDPGGATGSIG